MHRYTQEQRFLLKGLAEAHRALAELSELSALSIEQRVQQKRLRRVVIALELDCVQAGKRMTNALTYLAWVSSVHRAQGCMTDTDVLRFAEDNALIDPPTREVERWIASRSEG